LKHKCSIFIDTKISRTNLAGRAAKSMPKDGSKNLKYLHSPLILCIAENQ
jgi:hypothetical protein